MERLSDGRALSKGKYALGQYCTVQNRKRCAGVENRIPASRFLPSGNPLRLVNFFSRHPGVFPGPLWAT